MDTPAKHRNNSDSALLFRPWDCQNSLKSTEAPHIEANKPKPKPLPQMVQAGEKCSQVSNMDPLPYGVPSFGPFHTNGGSKDQANLLSLMAHHGAPCFYPVGNSKFVQPNPVECNLKSNVSHLPPLPVAAHGFKAANIAPNGLFGIPNLFAYNFSTNLPSTLFPPNQAHFDNLMTNKALLSSASANALNVTDLEKAIEQQQQNLLERTPKKQRPKRHQCPHCQVSFSNNGQLKGHIRIHTGERPFVCDQPNCGKTFTRNEELTRHKRIHTGLRPFACSICNKRFGRKDHLKKHVKTHQRPAPIPMPLALDPALSYAALAYSSWL